MKHFFTFLFILPAVLCAQSLNTMYVVVNPNADYGVTGDGITDDTTALYAMRTGILTQQTLRPNTCFVIQAPPGHNQFTYSMNRWTWGISCVILDMNGGTIQDTATSALGVEKYPLVTNGGAWYTCPADEFTFSTPTACNINSTTAVGYLINSAAPGSTTITTTTAGDAANFATGDWLLIYSFNQSAVLQGLYPPHNRYAEWHQVTNVTGAVITLDYPVAYNQSATYPEDPNYSAVNASVSGRARIINLKGPNFGPQLYFELRNTNILTNPNAGGLTPKQQYFWLWNALNAKIDNCTMPSLGPEIIQHAMVSRSTLPYVEVDTNIGNWTFLDDVVGETFNGQGASAIVIQGGTYQQPVILDPRALKIDGAVLNGGAVVSPVFGASFAVNEGTGQGPTSLEIKNSVLNGQGVYVAGGQGWVFQPAQRSINVDGTVVTLTTASGITTLQAPFNVTLTATLSTSSNTITSISPALTANSALYIVAADAITGTGLVAGTSISSVNVGANTITLNTRPGTNSSQTLTVFANPFWQFFACMDSGTPIIVTPTVGVPIWGIAGTSLGGTSSLQNPIRFSGTVPAGSTLTCNTGTHLEMHNNTYNNWIFTSSANTFASVPIYPWFPVTNIEDIITQGGDHLRFKIDTTNFGGGQEFNIFGQITDLKVNVLRPYTGADSTATVKLVPNDTNASTTNEILNLYDPGLREFTAGQAINAAIGDVATNPLGYFYMQGLNILSLNAGSQGQLDGVPSLQAIYQVDVQVYSPFRSLIQ